MLYLSRLRLENIRCFEELEIDLGADGQHAGWTVILGDNATGKTALLRSIAIGLCDQASAAGLITESTEGYIRRTKSKASILLSLRDDAPADDREYTIETNFVRTDCADGSSYESVLQETDPKPADFPWKNLFVSGYGAGRGMAGTGDVSGYSQIDAVYNMFTYSEGLQNPELVIHRLKERGVEDRPILEQIASFMEIDDLRMTARGILADGPWGKGMPIRDLADGYRSSFSWVADLVGWALAFRPDLKTTAGIRGIVLIDEIEAHLHARWQRRVIASLRQMFPKVQFIATSHSPLVAASVGPHQADALAVLSLMPGNRVEASEAGFMKGWRMDQVLASPAFRSLIDSDPVVEEMMKEASELAGKTDRSEEEDRRYRQICESLRPVLLSDGQTLFERKLELSKYDEVRRKVVDLRDQLRREAPQ